MPEIGTFSNSKSSPIKVGINGFGRIGRLVFRALSDKTTSNELTIIHVNEPKSTPETSAYLLEWDSIHGRWIPNTNENSFTVNGNESVDWSNCDIVLECSGKFKTKSKLAPLFQHGVKKVIVAAPLKEGVLNVVMGVNDCKYNPKTDHIITAASCTTNCIAPVIQVLHDTIGISHGMITTIHNVTNTQTVLDAHWPAQKDVCVVPASMFPTSTGSAKAIGDVIPELAGKLNGYAVRVPVANASLTDCVFEMQRETTTCEVNQVLTNAASSGSKKGILGVYVVKPLVSTDYTNDPRSGIVDAASTMVVNGTQVKVYIWYDNEWGYSNRMAELCVKVGNCL
eukprot:GSMAST32.ASY1.ANO1.1080.1 assembled CDS